MRYASRIDANVSKGVNMPSYKKGPRSGEPLTVRECEVALLMTEGHSNKIIADRLGIAQHTTKFHVANVVVKLGGKSRTRTEAAVIYARRIDAITAKKKADAQDKWFAEQQDARYG